MATESATRTQFPTVRMRRLRTTAAMRTMVRETGISGHDLIYPLFVTTTAGEKQEISSMPGVYRHPVDRLPEEIEEIVRLGIPAVLIFGLPSEKDEVGSDAYHDRGVVQEALRTIKHEAPQLLVMTDVCLCEYTSHGHCGIIVDGHVDNDVTLEYLARTALSHAEAGADIVSPSAMMDGQVATIRQALDERGFGQTAIMAYGAKFASSFYGPFRDAVDSSPQFGDRRGYQMDPANSREALRELEMDATEGADILMVKPALAYLDIIGKARERFPHPLAAYNVSGEYAMVKAAAQLGWLDERGAVLEMLTAIKRAGADLIITYFAKEVVQWLRES